jgi:hypothetical protein
VASCVVMNCRITYGLVLMNLNRLLIPPWG